MGKNIMFLSPVDGDMLCAHDGQVKGKSLSTRVSVAAEKRQRITINGAEAQEQDGIYTADVTLTSTENVLVAENPARGDREEITVWWLPELAGKYRLSLDDCIWYLRDLAENDYESIFENEYLGFLKSVHDTYATKVHSNIYWIDDVDDAFIIDSVSAKYRAEWEANADWLRLSFHARANKPDSPYKNADYGQMFYDVRRIREQIARFAGEKLLGPVTTLHWGAATREGSRALRDAGYPVQVGDFNCDNGLTPVSYYLDLAQRRNLNRRYIWRDNAEGIVFFRSAIIIDTHPLEEIPAFLDEIYSDPHRNPYMDLLIHEQYFYPSYERYQPNYRDKVLCAVKWAVERGYQPAFLDEVIPNTIHF